MAKILAVALNPTIDISCDADRVQPTLKVRTHNQRHHPGGGGVNVARVIAELGGQVELAYLSGGASGILLDNLLADSQVKLSRFGIKGAVRVAFMVYEEKSGLEYRFVPEGPAVSAEELAPLFDQIEAHGDDMVVASGSLPVGAPADTYARMAKAVMKAGGRFILDTSGEALKATLEQARVFLVKPSLGELERFAGYSLDDDGAHEVALDLVRSGAAEHVALTFGRKGALLVNADGVTRLPAMHVDARSAVGAGDSFIGALTWSLVRGDTIGEAFRWGVAAGAAAVMTPGTELCRLKDVEGLFENARPKQSG